MNTVERINRDVWKLWENTFQDNEKHKDILVPYIYPSDLSHKNALKKNALLFIHLNPSFTSECIEIVKRVDPDALEKYKWINRHRYNITMKKIESIEADARCENSFYKVFEEIAKRVEVQDEHVDLFFYRKTEQEDVKRNMGTSEKGSFHLSSFGAQQIEYSKELVKYLEPRVIVVANKFASDRFCDAYRIAVSKHMIGKERDLTLDDIWNEREGFYCLPLGGKLIPLFLNSMLCRQRALDIYSRERLTWHIKKALQWNRKY